MKGDTFYLQISFETVKNATALSWLEADKTVDKKLPFIYSSNEPVGARSMFPC